MASIFELLKPYEGIPAQKPERWDQGNFDFKESKKFSPELGLFTDEQYAEFFKAASTLLTSVSKPEEYKTSELSYTYQLHSLTPESQKTFVPFLDSTQFTGESNIEARIQIADRILEPVKAIHQAIEGKPLTEFDGEKVKQQLGLWLADRKINMTMYTSLYGDLLAREMLLAVKK